MSQQMTVEAPTNGPTGRTMKRSAISTRPHNRMVAAMVFAATAGLLLFASYLDPEPNAAGQQTDLSSFGYPGCGFRMQTGLPCMTCDMTTSFSYMADGRFAAGFVTQPAGALLAIFTAMLWACAAVGLITGASLVPLGQRLWRGPIVFWAIAILLAAWAYNIAMTVGY